MKSTLSSVVRSPLAALPRRPGVSLIEVLTLMSILAVGLLAILAVFPLGALEMARMIRDDRAGNAAAHAVALSEAGQELLSRTRDFVLVSALSGSTDPKTVAVLQADYGDLGVQAAEVEAQLREVRPLAPNPKARRLVDRLLVQIRSIKLSIDAMGRLLYLLSGSVPTD